MLVVLVVLNSFGDFLFFYMILLLDSLVFFVDFSFLEGVLFLVRFGFDIGGILCKVVFFELIIIVEI